MATRMLKCKSDDHRKTDKRFDRYTMKWHNNKAYCKECYDKYFGNSQIRNNIFAVLRKIFDLGDYADIPLSIDHQIDKYIKEYGFTEQGIYNTLCYIYFEYDFSDFNIKYGIYFILDEYKEHHNFTFDTNIKVNKQTVKHVHTSVKPSNSKVIKKIEKLELNEIE